MKRIYTYGGQPADRNLTVADIIAAKGNTQFTQVSATDADEAAACEQNGIDMISIWDSDTEVVRQAAPNTFVIAGLGMTAYATNEEILRAAIKAAEAGADAVYTARGLDVVRMLVAEGLCVQGHLGLVPRLSTRIGGLRAVGKTAEEAIRLFDDFRRLEDAGAYAVEVECVAAPALEEITQRTGLITHSIGSGPAGDVIFCFMEDICGDTPNPPRHARAFGGLQSLRTQIVNERGSSLDQFRAAVRDRTYPGPSESISMKPAELDAFREHLAQSTQ
ncbi:3-methyl-2-oxobutanoate hydroxymethyltransferase [Ruegeria sp.]|uniref:3-methyl-2-oxobutanoate hydroxymethyltransferase n=1 Tax=Ruegeria sp. TaxID=1879320 RepID=UPI003C7A5E88